MALGIPEGQKALGVPEGEALKAVLDKARTPGDTREAVEGEIKKQILKALDEGRVPVGVTLGVLTFFLKPVKSRFGLSITWCAKLPESKHAPVTLAARKAFR